MPLTDPERRAIAAGRLALNASLTSMRQSRDEAVRMNLLDLAAEWDVHLIRTVSDVQVLDRLLSTHPIEVAA